MARARRPPSCKLGEGIVGVRMSRELIADLKAEALRRKISLGKLIQELWASYRSTRKEE
jgi:predicted HicB family RNase H-like nuclease